MYVNSTMTTCDFVEYTWMIFQKMRLSDFGRIFERG